MDAGKVALNVNEQSENTTNASHDISTAYNIRVCIYTFSVYVQSMYTYAKPTKDDPKSLNVN